MKFANWSACLAALLHCTFPEAASLSHVERDYAEMNDAYGALSFVESGYQPTYEGKDRAQWKQTLERVRAKLSQRLSTIDVKTLSPLDRRAVEVMREGVAALAEEGSLAPTHRCADAQNKELPPVQLRAALYSCFDELANNIQFEGATLTRVGAFDALTRLDDPAKRKALFHAFTPLWGAVNAGSEPDSPYRRMIGAAATEGREKGSAFDAAAKTVGITTAELERWLLRILETWRDVNTGDAVEPWDYRYRDGAADRDIGEAVPLDGMQPLNERFYRDLGAPLDQWSVVYDVKQRKGKAPLAYADYIRRGRTINGQWRPTRTRVSANYSRGGLGPLNELVHENGHIAHMMALHTRPAFMDLGDAVFYEAFADVPAWSVFEPAWQQKYLGKRASEQASLRALYSNVMLDVAWSLFDLRMLRDPTLDPNIVWTNIMQQYFNVTPHPELAWWAVRVQLVDSPGYMVNYGLGAVITAHIRQRIRDRLGAFDTGDVRWFAWLSEKLLSSGYEKETAALLREFLGGPVSVEPLLDEVRRMKAEKK